MTIPKAAVIRLEQNYRSTKNDSGGGQRAWWRNNKERKGKWLWTESNEGAPIGVYEAPDGENEALFIADTIEKILAPGAGSRTWRCCTAPISSRGRSKRRCGDTGGSTWWWAASASISGPR